jgi:uncharacterized protein YhbP (UPF0306 family)
MNIPDENLMTISANDLKERPPESGLLRGEVRRHIKQIETEIREAQRVKEDFVRHEIATNFPVSKISNKRAQIFIYSAIVDQLKMNGFKVALNLDHKQCHFLIRWAARTDHDELSRQKQLIAEARAGGGSD